MSNAQVVKRIKNKDWSILDPPAMISPDAAEVIIFLLDSKDFEVRELTVYCLDLAGGENAKEGLFHALHNKYSMARAAAGRLLGNHVTKQDVPRLFKELVGNEDEYVREQVALTLGNVGYQENTDTLKKMMINEKDKNARHAFILALIRLGDAEQKKAYIGRFEVDSVESRVEALNDLPYLQQREYIKHVLPLLDDRRDAVNVAPGGHVYFIRVCDHAINVLHKAFDMLFSFPVKQAVRYTDEELKKAKTTLSGL